MEFHPIADEWPLMDGEPFANLTASVAKHGVRVPCWKFEGKVLDGRNRVRAAEVAGVPVLNWHEFTGTEDEARELARLLNDERRHLSREDRNLWIAKLKSHGLSNVAVADAVGVNESTVRRVSSGSADAEPDEMKATGLNGRLAKVQELKGIGRTDEEVAEELGVSTKTVQRAKVDIAEKVKEATPKVTGKDGKKHLAKRPEARPAKRRVLRIDGLINLVIDGGRGEIGQPDTLFASARPD